MTNGCEHSLPISTGPTMLIENAFMVYAIAAIAAFCFKHRDPRKAR